jgi:hypothetical protein
MSLSEGKTAKKNSARHVNEFYRTSENDSPDLT